MIVFTYIFLLLLMLYILYVTARSIQKKDKIISSAGLLALAVYTLNEGLRFGRGIDYNLYGRDFETFANYGESDQHIGLMLIEKILIALDMPWQMCVLLMSFMFILGTLCLLKRHFNDVLSWALPLFVLLSMSRVENMVRWYLGFSFIMIGFSYQVIGKYEIKKEFIVYSLLGCTIHYALLPIPFLLYLLALIKKTIIHPFFSIPLFFLIAFFFQTSFMMELSNLANILLSTSERFEQYGDDLEFWLTGGFAGADRTALPRMSEILFLCTLAYAGYKPAKMLGGTYLYAYNLFLIGFVTLPIARQIELFSRFNAIFYFFGAIVLAIIIEYVYIRRIISIGAPFFYFFVLLVFLNYGRVVFTDPINGNPNYFLYVWDQGNKTYDDMYQLWKSDLKYGSSKNKRDN